MVLKTVKARNARPFLAAIMAALIAVVATATMSGGWASAQSDGTDGTAPGGTDVTPTTVPTAQPGDTAEGQLVRRGLTGKVVRKGDTSFIVETRSGLVHVLVNDETDIRKPPEGLVRFDALEVGDKVGILLVKPEDDDTSGADASLAGTDTIIRTATALKVLIVPDRATRRHIRAMVVEKLKDRIKVIDENGNEQEIETDVTVDSEAGDELLLVTQDDDNGKGRRLRAFVVPHILEARLDRIEQKRQDIKDKLEEVRERLAEQRTEVIDRVKERLSNIEVDADTKARLRVAADEVKNKLEATIEQARQNAEERQKERQDKVQATREAKADNSRGSTGNDVRPSPTPEPTREGQDSSRSGDSGTDDDTPVASVEVDVSGSLTITK